MSSKPARSRRWLPLPLDRVVLGATVGLAIVTALLILLGDHAQARVTTFSWQEKTIGADNTAFLMTFSRPMDTASVAANLSITPSLPGRISWAGRRMAYTLNEPIPYGEDFRITLPEARDRFSQDDADAPFEAFAARFHSRDRAMVYIGTQGSEKGRLVLMNFSAGGEPRLLTPPELTVLDFEPYPLGDRVLFSAIETAAADTGILAPVLYAVTTGLSPEPPEDPNIDGAVTTASTAAPGEITTVLDSEIYQNLAFDLSPDGQIIIVQRINQADPADFGPWIVRENDPPTPLDVEPGGEFLIAPDNQTLLMLQGQGTAVIPLNLEDGEAARSDPLDFLPEFGRVFDLTTNGATAAMANFNQNDPERRFTESLVLINNQGIETEVLNVSGSILQAQFDPTDRILYVLASELLPRAAYQEQPFLTAISLEAQESTPLLSFPPQARTSLSISPDGLAALIEVAAPSESTDGATGEAVPESFSVQTLLLPLFTTTEDRLAGTPAPTPPQVLPFAGVRPTWLP